jgi:TolB-like protein/tetratricopeptide (TPR) repeat protein
VLLPLVAELNRRRVFRALVVYGVVAFAVLQIIEPVMHGLHWPEAVLSYVVVALALGFPVVVGFAWAFDVGASGVERSAPDAGLRGVSLALVLIAVGLLAAAPGLGWYLLRGKVRFGDEIQSGAVNGSSAPMKAPSIAVLPFVDMSPGKDQEYLADGIAEEILNSLAHIEGLSVIGRTSSFSFKGRSEDLRAIGERLSVAHLLEGSIRRSGSRIRVTAQLVETQRGSHLWSQVYDREVTDVFAVQDAIARAVVDALEVKLLPGHQPTTAAYRTSNVAVHDSYLLATELNARGSEQGFRSAATELEKAIAVDPSYAPAWAALAGTLRGLWDLAEPGTASLEALQQRALAAAEKVVQLAPEQPDSYTTRARIRAAMLDWIGAQSDLDRALQLGAPKCVQSDLFATRGDLRNALECAEAETKSDPLSSAAWNWLGFLRYANGDLELANRALARSLEISPDNAWAIRNIANTRLAQRKPAEALEIVARSSEEVFRLRVAAVAQHDLGHPAESKHAIDALVANYGDSRPWNVAVAFASIGEPEAALEWLERAHAHRDLGLKYIKYHPALRTLHGRARFTGLLRKLKLPPD